MLPLLAVCHPIGSHHSVELLPRLAVCRPVDSHHGDELQPRLAVCCHVGGHHSNELLACLVELDKDDHVGEDGAQQASQRTAADCKIAHRTWLQFTSQPPVGQLSKRSAQLWTPALISGAPRDS